MIFGEDRTYLERPRGSGEPPDIFCTIPGVGPTLAKRLHETLHVETLEQLEAALHEKNGKSVPGIVPRRLAILRAALSQMLARIRPVRTGPADEPPVGVRPTLQSERRGLASHSAYAPRKVALHGIVLKYFPRARTRQGAGLGRPLFSFRQRRRGATHDRDRNARGSRRTARGPRRERECLSVYERAAS